MDQIEPLNMYKFLEAHHKHIKKLIYSSCGQYNIRKLMLPVRKVKKYIFEGINETRGKYALTDLLRERTSHIKTLEFKNSSVWEREFARFDIWVLPKLKKLVIQNWKGFTTIDQLIKTTNCPQLREVYIDSLKLFEPELVENVFLNGYEIRVLTLIFYHSDGVEVFNKGLANVIARIMRKYARFMPLPLCIFNNLEKITVSDINYETIEMFKQIHMIDYDIYTKFHVFEARTNKRLL